MGFGKTTAGAFHIALATGPAGDVAPGSRVFLQGGAPSAAPPKTLKSAPWAQIKELLRVKGGVATFNGTPLVTDEGLVTVPDLPDGAAIS